MATAPLPAPQALPYWPPLIISGQAVDLAHLEPFQLVCPCPEVPRPLVVDVTFTNHCFTDHYQDGVHDPAWKIMDHMRERVFCFTRHTLSRRLPAMVRGLPGAAVHQTVHERNYVYATALTDEAGHSYAITASTTRASPRSCARRRA